MGRVMERWGIVIRYWSCFLAGVLENMDNETCSVALSNRYLKSPINGPALHFPDALPTSSAFSFPIV